ncbi:U3 small nucleolar RNA-associated protein 25 [Setomelanomma holmii]|uniref:U3 small nucleolar RNA-associated protein 25 n=1 Tax=Setomelanomma holmii TaxID=210430 RepID=A0A9P4H2T2_9PLEO|nr:U3 small nucleolar RNA-associated protein 25 [Setomelanomma holmii]
MLTPCSASATRQSPKPEESQSDESDASASEEDDEEDAQPTSNAYAVLMKSLSQHAPILSNGSPLEYNVAEQPRRKRRKIEQESLVVREVPHVMVELHELGDFEEEAVLQPERQGLSPRNAVAEVQESAEVNEPEGADDDLSKEALYEKHFAAQDESELAIRVERISKNQWSAKKVEYGGGRGVLQTPSAENIALERPRVRSTRDVQLKARLADNAHKIVGTFKEGAERAIAPSIFAYQDVLFGARTVQNAGRLRDITCLHALNHVLTGRDKVLKNNAKLAAANEDADVEYRDQGFTRPKVLFLLETKQACVRVLESITKLASFEQQENKKRFLDSFSLDEKKFSDDKPADFRELFEGNDENEFRVGVKLTRKTLKLYSTFYNSDIIFASTLGLRRAIESGDPKKRDYDFLSSIEMVIMEQADATLMQNWEHAEFVFEHLNLQPKDAHGCDFSRVRSWYLDDHAKYIRQTIVLSAFLTPKINTLYNKHMCNVAGRLKYTATFTSGLIESLSYGIKQSFLRFDSPSHLTDPNARFKYFSSTVMPSIMRLPKPLEGGAGVLVFIPSYLDFVRVRNSLVDTEISYASISEYTDQTDVRKARSHFMNGKHSLLLYTGRAHHFHRYNIRGVKRVVFYGVPENPIFYEEVLGFIGKSIERAEISRAEANVRVCFSKWERMELDRIVGTKRVGKMIGDKGDVFDFV